MNPGTADLEYHLEKSFVKGLRAVFLDEADFIYNPLEEYTKVMITASYPHTDIDCKIPQITVSNASFTLSQTSLYNNFEDAIIETDKDGFNRHVGNRFATVVPYSIQINCLAEEEGISKDLANRVINLIHFEARELFSDVLLLNVQSVSKGGSGYMKSSPNNTFQSTISVSGTVYWYGEKRVKLPKYISNLDLIGRYAKDFKDFKKPYDEKDYELIARIKFVEPLEPSKK